MIRLWNFNGADGLGFAVGGVDGSCANDGSGPETATSRIAETVAGSWLRGRVFLENAFVSVVLKSEGCFDPSLPRMMFRAPKNTFLMVTKCDHSCLQDQYTSNEERVRMFGWNRAFGRQTARGAMSVQSAWPGRRTLAVRNTPQVGCLASHSLADVSPSAAAFFIQRWALPLSTGVPSPSAYI